VKRVRTIENLSLRLRIKLHR